MKDKSVSMPGKPSAWARASLGKHAINAKANKARPCTTFPSRQYYIAQALLS
jgi:hypothetical protein